jgi:peroxiredoxin
VDAARAAPLAFKLRDADGTVHSNAELMRHKVTVFIFLATDCPNSNSYAPALARLWAQDKDHGVAFYSVYSDPAETAGNVRHHDREYGIPFPALLDPHQVLARETRANVTPEVVVASAAGEELYRGRIDDRFANFGRTRTHVDKHDLRDALDQILAGKPVSHPYEPSRGNSRPAAYQISGSFRFVFC